MQIFSSVVTIYQATTQLTYKLFVRLSTAVGLIARALTGLIRKNFLTK